MLYTVSQTSSFSESDHQMFIFQKKYQDTNNASEKNTNQILNEKLDETTFVCVSMNIISVLRIAIILLLFCQISSGFITRLNCLIHANFTIMERGKYLLGTLIKTIHHLTEKKCMLECIGTENCCYVNYEQENQICEIQNKTNMVDYVLEVKQGWSFLSTNYADDKNIGPRCTTLNPCDFKSQCFDQCDAEPFYKCQPILTQISGIPSLSSEYPGQGSQYCNDGLENTVCSTHVGKNAWLRFDLQKSYKVHTVRIFLVAERRSSMTGRIIYIGNQDNEGIEGITSNNLFAVCYPDVELYRNASMEFNGRYVFVYRQDGPFVDTSEFEVYFRK